MIKRILLITLCLIPLAAFADPATQRGKSNRPGPPFKRPTSRPADDPQEFNSALGFLEKMSPNRFNAYQSLDEDRKGIFRERIIAFYRVNQWVNREDNDELRKLREKLIKAEDDVFAIRWEILAAGGPRKASDQDRLRLRNAVAEMVKVQLDERAVRLERFKKYVKQEEEQIAGIKANPDQYIDDRYRDELEGRGMGLFDHPRRHDGSPGGPGGPGPNNPPGQGNPDKPPRRDPKP
ncbi:MAG TPA: hypothetical protein VGQ99_20300 [Tepidisphaeraceae bacterium]|jgi:hypothetical protein|nr:hypothetical protein [Tepidisphaeraceae bacterium]